MIIKPLNVLALACGASFGSLKDSFIKTDGIDVYETYRAQETPLPDFLRVKIGLVYSKNLNNPDDKVLIDTVESDITDVMIERLSEIIPSLDQKPDLIAIEGPTIAHDIETKYTYQLCKGRKIFEAFGIPTVSHFHNADILNGGQGNPIEATYYEALAAQMPKPALFIHIGTVSSLTYIGALGEMLSFDCGAGVQMLNDFMKKHAAVAMDYNGKCAACGQANFKIVQNLMQQKFFAKTPPKSMPHNLFKDKEEHFEGLSVEGGAATITEFIAEGIYQAVNTFLPPKPVAVVFCGGGSKNPTLVRLIKQKLRQIDISADNFLVSCVPNDASAIAFLAARRYYNLPITFPQTTGVVAPMIGGKIYDKDQI